MFYIEIFLSGLFSLSSKQPNDSTHNHPNRDSVETKLLFVRPSFFSNQPIGEQYVSQKIHSFENQYRV